MTRYIVQNEKKFEENFILGIIFSCNFLKKYLLKINVVIQPCKEQTFLFLLIVVF